MNKSNRKLPKFIEQSQQRNNKTQSFLLLKILPEDLVYIVLRHTLLPSDVTSATIDFVEIYINIANTLEASKNLPRNCKKDKHFTKTHLCEKNLISHATK